MGSGFSLPHAVWHCRWALEQWWETLLAIIQKIGIVNTVQKTAWPSLCHELQWIKSTKNRLLRHKTSSTCKVHCVATASNLKKLLWKLILGLYYVIYSLVALVNCSLWRSGDIFSASRCILVKATMTLDFWLSKEHLNKTRRAPGCQAEKSRTLLLLHFSHAAMLRFEMNHEGCVIFFCRSSYQQFWR